MTLRRLITKRACVRLTLLLVAGAIVNVAVAWAIATNGRIYSTPTSMRSSELPTWCRQVITDIDRSTDDFVLRGMGRDGTWINSSYESHNTAWIFIRNGWPMRSMGQLLEERFPPREWRAHWSFAIRRVAPGKDGTNAFLPFRPLWPGFAINTVFYAAILWMLFFAPFALRRRLRVKRGLCVKCAYDLRGGWGAGSTGGPDAVTCPECGATR